MSQATIPLLPEVYNRDFLLAHCRDILAFYNPRVIDPSGGFYHNYLDDGTLFNPGFRQLVSSTRIIVNYARASVALQQPEYKTVALHGLKYLEQVHYQPDSQRYAWTLQDHQPLDMTQQAYGYAFVLLAYSAVQQAGVAERRDKIAETFTLLEQRFWQEQYGLYADEISPEGVLGAYRGQNANMHLCEALLAAYQATGEARYLARAKQLAHNITFRQAGLTAGQVWEHYTEQFLPDWDYNKDDPKNLYRPWGFQPGHQTEWAKLLLQLNRLEADPQLVSKAQHLFDVAFDSAWDAQYGGLVYGYDPQGNWCDDDKYFWVQAESFAAAALLYQTTADNKYLSAYRQLWNYSWQHLVDHQYGAWFRLLNRQNQRYSNEKSSAGAKCDYHTLCACLDVLAAMPVDGRG